MSNPPQFESAVDPSRNLVRVRFAGDFTAPAMQQALAEVRGRLPELKPGFSVLTDFSDLTGMSFESVPHLTEIMDICRAAGVGFIVRILPAKKHDIGINILAHVHYRGEVKSVTVETRAEAEAFWK
jgi:hypothetical protein